MGSWMGSWIRGFVSLWLGSWVRGLVRALSGSWSELSAGDIILIAQMDRQTENGQTEKTETCVLACTHDDAKDIHPTQRQNKSKTKRNRSIDRKRSDRYENGTETKHLNTIRTARPLRGLAVRIEFKC